MKTKHALLIGVPASLVLGGLLAAVILKIRAENQAAGPGPVARRPVQKTKKQQPGKTQNPRSQRPTENPAVSQEAQAILDKIRKQNQQQPGATKEPKAKQAPRELTAPNGQKILEPTQEELQNLTTLKENKDIDGLWHFFKSSKSIARYEALRRFMEFGGASTLPKLASLLKDEDNPKLHDLIGAAFGAGGQEEDADILIRGLKTKKWSESARLAAAKALTIMASRFDGPSKQKMQSQAVRTLEPLLRSDHSDDALMALASNGEAGLRSMKALARNSRDEKVQLKVALALLKADPRTAFNTLKSLSKNARNEDVKKIALAAIQSGQGQ